MAQSKVAFPADSFFERILKVVDSAYPSAPKPAKIKLVCNECGKARWVSPDANFNDRCPKCGGVDWDVVEETIHRSFECSARACPVVGLHNTDECADLIAQDAREAGVR